MRSTACPALIHTVRDGLSGGVEIVSDADSRWKWGATVARRLVPDATVPLRGWLADGQSAPTDRQLRDVGATTALVTRSSVSGIVAELARSEADVVVLACAGGMVQAFMQRLARAWEGRPQRPVVVTGYVGLVYENLVDGLLLRAGADLVLANSDVDADRFRAVLGAVGADPDAVVRTALPFLGGSRHDPSAAGRDRPFTVTFAAQPGVPATRAERRHAARQLVEHARTHPDRQVVVKLRGRVGERTTHVEPHHYATLLPAGGLPPNVELVYGPMGPVLDRTDLCVTVSSTAALEAMQRNIPTGILTDFGIRESLGNQVFLDSGALVSWRRLHAGSLPTTDAGWAAHNGLRDADPFTAAATRVAELVHDRSRLGPLTPWYDAHNAAAYLPTLLARYGADVAAPVPLPGRMLQGAARRAYRVSANAIEPRLRRLAQL